MGNTANKKKKSKPGFDLTLIKSRDQARKVKVSFGVMNVVFTFLNQTEKVQM